MSFKLVEFYYYDDTSMLESINIQNIEINRHFPDLVIETVTQEDSRLSLYSSNNRLPFYIIFENNIRKAIVSGKLLDSEIIDWLNNNLS